MPVESWLLPVLWREADWRCALDRLRSELARVPSSTPSQRAALELGRACEYIDPDRARAMAAYALAGAGADRGRSRELATELGAWRARARLTLAARVVDGDPQLVLDEAEAWWDAGEPALCALALAELRSPEASLRELDLRALVAGSELALRAETAATRAAYEVGTEASDEHVMAARLVAAAGGDPRAHLEGALAATPTHAIAARKLLDLVLRAREPEAIQRYLQLRLNGLDGGAWLDAMRATALAMVGSEPHRGFGLRLLRQALERAYEQRDTNIPGHLAMWATLVAHATADGTRRELLPLALQAIECSRHEVDHVWLGVLATDITLRDARNPVVAGAYAEIVAEHAPEHPILAELVAAVAAAETAVPASAVSAAVKVQEDVPIDVDLDGLYADAVEEARVDARTEPAAASASKPGPRATPPPPPRARPAAPSPPAVATRPPPAVSPSTAASAPNAPAEPGKPAAPPKAMPITMPVPRLTAKPAAPAPAPATANAEAPKVGAMPSIKPPPTARPSAAPVLAALRTPDRPLLPPRPADPADAVPRARRIAIPIDVRVTVGGKTLEAHSRDLSTSGLFVLTSATLTIGAEVGVVLLVPGEEPFMEDEFRCAARVARKADGGYGLELVAPPADLLARLARLG